MSSISIRPLPLQGLSMDITRPSSVRRNRILRRSLYSAVVLLVVATAGIALVRLKPAAPTLDRSSVVVDLVRHGSLLRQVRGIGTLVPEDIRWIPATTQGRVERIVLRPGTLVTPVSLILELSNPQLEQELREAELKVNSAEATLENLRVQVQNDFLAQKATVATIGGEYQKAKMQAEMNDELYKRGIVSILTLKQSQVDAAQLADRDQIAREQLASSEHSTQARLAVQQSELDQAHTLLALKRQERAALNVRAGLEGVLQVVPVDVGQQVAPGTNLARVANPARLKAEVKIAETQAKDIQLGQKVDVDTRNGVVTGVVARMDPSVQNGTRTIDVTLLGALPRGAVPDLSIDGTIEIERLADVVYVGRPASGGEQSTVSLFKLLGTSGDAVRVPVKLGRSSVTAIEVISGLAVGDRVVLSDMSQWDGVDRVRIQ
jgi:HlyD family secretion protein